MALIIPPQLLALITAVFMWCIASSDLITAIENQYLAPLAMTIFAIGSVIGFMALVSLLRARTSLSCLNPGEARCIIRHGIYKVTRNPMYLSLALMLAAEVVLFGNVLNIVPLMFFVWYIDKFQIVPEERALEKRFPRQSAEYKASVRRWI